MKLTTSVVVCTAHHERKALLHACVDSLLAGTRVPDEILVVVDVNPSLRAELAVSLPPSVRLLETQRQGNSEGRNVGIEASGSDVVAFVDDDATVEAEWLSALLEVFEGDAAILGAGGCVVPSWGADRRWLRDELLWVVGCTYTGHREDPGPIRNPIGCNMAFRRAELLAIGGFATEFGKRGNALAICDETELSLRLERAHGFGRIHYVPGARVRHFVPGSRVSWRLLVRRSLSEGLSKGRLYRLYRAPALGRERDYVRRLVSRSVPLLLIRGLRGRDGRSLMGAGAIIVSLTITSAAFVVGATVGSWGDR